MKTILNIGLARNDGAPDNGILHVVAKINQYGLLIQAGEVFEVKHAHGIERTVVAEVVYTRHESYLPTTIYHLSGDLAQDCIAVAHQSDNGKLAGALYGPKVAEWGDFDPAFFVVLNN